MKIDQVYKRVAGIPHMTESQADTITAFITANKISSIIELGFCHGVSTCYMAAALDECSDGRITTIDLLAAKEKKPDIEILLTDLGLRDRVEIYYEPTSYLWRLMKLIEQDPNPRFDLCYLDGAHNWYVDGFAFFLVDKLLLPGGWIIFDDIDWSYSKSPTLKDTENVRKMPAEERDTPQIHKVFDLLVKQHPCYGDFMIKDGWAYAKKMHQDQSIQPTEVRKEIIYQKEHYGLGLYMKEVVNKIRKIGK
jgi:predicted O-methyltransferase YrrM